MSALVSRRAGTLKGTIRVPGDKSISHRALILGALAIGETTIAGLLEGDDVMRTAEALRAFGVEISPDGSGAATRWRVQGVGIGGLGEPDRVLDLGNAGTGARLLMGVAASHPFTTFFTGDASLRARPMGRVAEPLERMGARFVARDGLRLPLAVVGTDDLLPINYRLPVSSAQVKSAILLAGLAAPGWTTVIEPRPTRDHTERMLEYFGARVTIEPGADGTREVRVFGQPELSARQISVPGDPSSAAFLVAAALLVPGSEITIKDVGVNPLRVGFFETLR